MRKKSHMLLERYLADQMPEVNSLQCHRKAFCFGNILPDLRPSFLTTKHEFAGTFGSVQRRMKELVEYSPRETKERVYWRRLGEVLHYIADYFTFPHNPSFPGNLADHTHYEKMLKNSLKACVRSGEAERYLPRPRHFYSLRDLVDYIKLRHTVYMQKPRNIGDDIHFIISVCFQVAQGIVQLCARYQFYMENRAVMAA
ncbi:MAG: zinc dependent phospholipase C family protein [Clostridiales bacterium]|nr:zinc dependent phospholipase C family protein [Clostridiales bacterium]